MSICFGFSKIGFLTNVRLFIDLGKSLKHLSKLFFTKSKSKSPTKAITFLLSLSILLHEFITSAFVMFLRFSKMTVFV